MSYKIKGDILISGTSSVNNGSLSNLSLKFNNDLTTGIYSSSTSIINIVSNGNEILQINNSGIILENELKFDGIGNITTSGNQNLNIVPNGAALINFYNQYTFPNVDGTSGQTLVTDGAGVLSWGTGGGGVTSINTGGGLSGGPITSTGTVSLDITGQTLGTISGTDELIYWDGVNFYKTTANDIAALGGGGTFLPLSGGTMTGNIALNLGTLSNASLHYPGAANYGFNINSSGILQLVSNGISGLDVENTTANIIVNTNLSVAGTSTLTGIVTFTNRPVFDTTLAAPIGTETNTSIHYPGFTNFGFNVRGDGVLQLVSAGNSGLDVENTTANIIVNTNLSVTGTSTLTGIATFTNRPVFNTTLAAPIGTETNNSFHYPGLPEYGFNIRGDGVLQLVSNGNTGLDVENTTANIIVNTNLSVAGTSTLTGVATFINRPVFDTTIAAPAGTSSNVSYHRPSFSGYGLNFNSGTGNVELVSNTVVGISVDSTTADVTIPTNLTVTGTDNTIGFTASTLTDWVAPYPTTIQEAINRIAAHIAATLGAIP